MIYFNGEAVQIGDAVHLGEATTRKTGTFYRVDEL